MSQQPQQQQPQGQQGQQQGAIPGAYPGQGMQGTPPTWKPNSYQLYQPYQAPAQTAFSSYSPTAMGQIDQMYGYPAGASSALNAMNTPYWSSVLSGQPNAYAMGSAMPNQAASPQGSYNLGAMTGKGGGFGGGGSMPQRQLSGDFSSAGYASGFGG